MRHTEKTARKDARTAGKTATKNTNTATRIDRWRRLAEERIARLAESPELPGLAMLRTCAEIEGMTPADLIVDRLTRARAGGKIVERRPKDCCGAEFNAFIDTDYERNMSTRARNNHEREVVTFMIWDFAEGTWIPPRPREAVRGTVCAEILPQGGRRTFRRVSPHGDRRAFGAEIRRRLIRHLTATPIVAEAFSAGARLTAPNTKQPLSRHGERPCIVHGSVRFPCRDFLSGERK